MKKWILKLFLGKYFEYLLLCIICSIFLVYYGIYALMGNKVIVKTQGMIYLSTEASVTNIIIGIVSILFILKERSKRK